MKSLGIILTVGSIAFALEFSKAPVSQAVHFGERATFDALAVGKGTVKYTWYFNGAEVSGASASQFVTEPLTADNNGNAVLCIAQDESGFSLSSDEVKVQVLPVSSKTFMLEGDLELADGTNNFSTDMSVVLYNNLTGGSALYREEFVEDGRGTVTVKNGRFQVKLGGIDNGQSLGAVIQANNSLYVEFQIGKGGSYEVLSPRLPLTAFPFALSAPTSSPVGN